MEHIHERFSKLRKIINLKYREISYDIGIPISSASKYEKGIIKPGVETLEKIAVSYQVNLNWLIAGNGKIFTCQQDISLGNDKSFCLKIRVKKYFDKIRILPLSNELIETADNVRNNFLRNPEEAALELAKKYDRPVIVDYCLKENESIIKVYYVSGQIEVWDKADWAEKLNNIVDIINKIVSVSFDRDKISQISRFIYTIAQDENLIDPSVFSIDSIINIK